MSANNRLSAPDQRGFTLIEMAIVMLIMGLLLGSLLIPLSAQVENERRRTTQKSLDTINEALLGFAITHKRLPCPDTDGDGRENGPPCANSEGEIPWANLGVSRWDGWNRPLRYRVDNNFSATIPNPADTTSGLSVLDWANSALTVANPDAPVAIVFSCGPDGIPNGENDADGSPNASTGCTNPGAPNATYQQNTPIANGFDDILIFVSKNTLLSKLVSAGQWP